MPDAGAGRTSSEGDAGGLGRGGKAVYVPRGLEVGGVMERGAEKVDVGAGVIVGFGASMGGCEVWVVMCELTFMEVEEALL